MNCSKLLLAGAALAALATLAACGTPTPQVLAETDRVATLVAEALAVAATLTAGAPAQPPPTASATIQPNSTPTPTRLQVTVMSTPSPTRLTVTVITLPSPTRLTAVTIIPPIILPPKTVAPTPTPTRLKITVIPMPTPPVGIPTALKVAVLPVDGNAGNQALHNGRNVNSGRNVLLPGFSQTDVKSTMIFGDSVVFQVEVFDETVGKGDGDGIASVMFSISDASGKLVHQYMDSLAPFCVFESKAACSAWQFSKQAYRWPRGAALNLGVHDAQIKITPKKGEPTTWFWSFKIEK